MHQQTKVQLPKRAVDQLVSVPKVSRKFSRSRCTRYCAAAQSSGLSSVSMGPSTDAEPSTSKQNGANPPLTVADVPLNSEVSSALQF